MKLRTKLLINFTILFFVLINIFGCTLIKLIFNTSLNNTIDDSLTEYNMIYFNLKSGESMNRKFYDIQDIITLKNDTYLSTSNSIDLEVQDMDMNMIYSSMDERNEIQKDFYKFDDDTSVNYMISDNNKYHILLINKEITFANKQYYLIYTNNIEHIYAEQTSYFGLLVLFNIISGLISILVIYQFTKVITEPLHQLVNNIDAIVKQNYNSELKDYSNIKEINILTDNFNNMSHEISAQMASLEQSNQEKQRFIDSLTHEIRTPLTSIIGYSSLCRNKNDVSESAVYQAFENIYKSGKRIENLTENLIKLITLDKAALNLKPLNVRKVLADIQNTYQARLEQETVEFSIIGEDFIITSDEYLLGMLFSNLIDNAVKAVMECSRKTIQIKLSEASVTISDSGKGMLQEDIEKIFEPFYMIDKSRKRTSEGFGLGLAICYNIMHILNIRFQVESKIDKGTDIILFFYGGAYEKE